MPRILEREQCPHCEGELGSPTPRVCPSCGGSLQKRYLALGCLSSAPPVVLGAVGVGWWALRQVSELLAG